MITKTSRLYRIVVILIVFIMVTLTGCNEMSGFASFKLLDDYKNVSDDVISENDRIALKWNEKEKLVYFYDKANDVEWGYSSATKLSADGEEEKINPQVLSPIMVGYFDQSNYGEKIVYAYTSSIKKNTVYSEKIDNGISVRYDFKIEGFSVTVDYILRNDSILVSIDKSKITEGTEKIITKVAISPYFCAVKNGTDNSYVFVPSGSGALIYPEMKLSSKNETSDPVYGRDHTIEEYYRFEEPQAVRLPIYGVKNGNAGLCAIIEEQPETCNIHTMSNNKNVGYTSVYSMSWLRGYNSIELPAAFGSEAYTKLFSDAIDKTTYSVGFYPFGGENCSYVDMAKIYRNYITEKSNTPLVKSEKEDKAINLNIIGGVMLKDLFLGVPYQSFHKLTSINQASGILSKVSDGLDNNLNVILSGFTETGLDPGKIAGDGKVSNKLGSKKELKDFFNLFESQNVDLFINFDMIRFNKSGFGCSTSGDTALKTDQKRIKITYKNLATGLNLENNSYQILSRNSFEEANQNLVEVAKKNGYKNISLDTLSNMSYSDYASKDYYAKTGISTQVYNILNRYKENDMRICGSQANDYFANLSDHITNVPLSSAEYDSFDETVPFYQIVYKGFVPMSSSNINSLSNMKTLFLKAIESGVGISFAVANGYSTEVFNSVHNISYVYNESELKESIDDLKDSGYIDFFNAIKNAKITNHQILNNGIRKTVFDNGVTVYVNYTNEAISVEGNDIDAQSYIYVKG